MKPIDFRNETFAGLSDRIAGQREAVLAAWRTHGPGTTEKVAERSGISILSFRPRTTELYQLGFVMLVDGACAESGGRYRVRTDAELRAWFQEQTNFANNPQRQLAL